MRNSNNPWSPEGSTTFNLVNKFGQNLAHLCTQLGYNRLLTLVIKQWVYIGIRDTNGVGGVGDSSYYWLGSVAATHPSRFRESCV